MKADYKNWMPKGMVASFIGGTAGALAIVPAVRIMMPEGPAKTVVTAVSAAAVCACGQRSAGYRDRKAKSQGRGDRH